MAKKINNGRIQIEKHSISEVFDYVRAAPRNGQRVRFYGHDMNLRCPNMLSFYLNGVRCCECGEYGAFFAKERYGNDPPHLNLYGFTKQGGYLLFNRDHIKPKDKGGTNHLYNSQTMCQVCNSKKGNTWRTKDKIRYYCKKFIYWIKYGKGPM